MNVYESEEGMAVLIIVLVFCLVVDDSQTTDPCLTYENLVADSTRSPSHVEPVHGNKICDATLSEKWYRWMGDAGTDLTNDQSVLVDNGCGTHNQLWMNGSIPAESDGIVDRMICVVSVFSNCHTSFTVQVKNCCSFRVYNLKSASSCPTSYCVSPSSVPAVDCPTTTTTTTTTTSTTTKTTTTAGTTTTTVATTTGTTTQKKPGKTISGSKDLTIVNTVSNDIIITVVVLLVIIIVILIGIVVFKLNKCSKVDDAERQSRYQLTAVEHFPHNNNQCVYVPPQVIQKGGTNGRPPIYTSHV